MSVKLLYFGPQWTGSTSLQRLHAFQQIDGLEAIGVDCGADVGAKSTLWRRVRWKLRLPVDALRENERLLDAVAAHRPDIVLVDNSKVIARETLERIRRSGVSRLVYYSPDDIVARHNLSLPLKWTLPSWDIVCTTKTFNIPELAALGVPRPFLIGKAFDPQLHRPMSPEQVGPDYERYDAVFVGDWEQQRCASINALAEAGCAVVVFGANIKKWRRSRLHPSIDLRMPAYGEDYVVALHTAKVALCFLRKINRDRITQRTMEIAASARPMVAERTDEHDAHFAHGREYLGFESDSELVQRVRSLAQDDSLRMSIAESARRRCMASGYSTAERARQMLNAFLEGK
ncbi:MAG: glycosyltransferase [Burkholderiales bacterium]|nr:glycosyltransferase [Burkholderiales bacterium]